MLCCAGQAATNSAAPAKDAAGQSPWCVNVDFNGIAPHGGATYSGTCMALDAGTVWNGVAFPAADDGQGLIGSYQRLMELYDPGTADQEAVLWKDYYKSLRALATRQCRKPAKKRLPRCSPDAAPKKEKKQ